MKTEESCSPRRMNHSSRSGFTLIELLVVITIIMILARILFPVVGAARKKAQAAKCASNMRQLGIAFRAYTMDWGVYPGCGGTGLSASEWVGLNAALKPVSCWPRTSALGVYTNPGKDPGKLNLAPTTAAEWAYEAKCRGTIYWCPADKHETHAANPANNFYISYQMSNGGTTCRWSNNRPNQIANPAGKYLVFEEASSGSNNNDGMFLCDVGPGGGGPEHVTDRHSGGANALYADGHVKWTRRGKNPSDPCTSATPGTFEWDVSFCGGGQVRGCAPTGGDATTY